MRTAGLFAAGAAVLIAGAGSAAWLVRNGAEPAEVASGRHVYAEHCASCHGADLQGQPNWQTRLPNGRLPAPPHDATGHTWHHGDDQLFAIVKRGVSAIVPTYENDMPGFEGQLSDGEIQAVIGFIKSTWPEREREYQAGRSTPR